MNFTNLYLEILLLLWGVYFTGLAFYFCVMEYFQPQTKGKHDDCTIFVGTTFPENAKQNQIFLNVTTNATFMRYGDGWVRVVKTKKPPT